MMRLYLIKIVLLAVWGLSLAGCGGPPPGVKGIDEREIINDNNTPHLKISRVAFNHYVNGTIFEAMGDYYHAMPQYYEALKYMPESDLIRLAYATSLLMLKDYPRALDEVRKIDPRDADAWLLIGDCFRSMGEYDSTLNPYLKAVALDSELVAPYYYIGAVYQQRQEYDSAIWAFQNITRMSANYQVYRQLAGLQLRAGYLDDAEKSYELSLAMDSSENNLRSMVALSAIYEERGDTEAARLALEKAVALAPNDVMLLSRLMGFKQEAGQYAQAIGLAHRLIELTPQDYALIRRLGVVYSQMDSLAQADSIFTDLIDRGDDSFLNYYYSGRLAFERNDLERAKKRFRHMTVAADSVIDGWMNLGLVYRRQDSTELEITTYENSLDHLTNLDDSLVVMFSIGATLEQDGQADRAIDVFERIIALNPNHGQALNYLGYMLADRNLRLDYALDLVIRALEIEPENGAFLDSHGWVLYKLGRHKKALKQLLEAYKYIDSDPVILDHIGDIYRALGQENRAREFWNKALEIDPDNMTVREKLGP